MFKTNLSFTPVIIEFKDGTTKLTFLINGLIDEDGDPYFSNNLINKNGKVFAQKTEQFNSYQIVSIKQLKEEKGEAKNEV